MPLAAAIPYVVGAASAYGAISQADSARKAAHAQQDAANASQVDIGALQNQVSQISKQNAIDSAALEQQLTPLVPQLRNAANAGILQSLGNDPYSTQAGGLLSGLGTLNTPLLQAAIAKARANLALGGSLDRDTQNAVTRSSLANAGTVAGPGGGLGLGRDLTARDLGLTSLQLQQQRLSDAGTFGGMEANLAQQNQGNLIAKINLLRGLSSDSFQKNLAAGAYGESIRQPLVGLDPGSIANIVVGNRNAQGAALANQGNIYGQQGQGFGQLFGGSLGLLSQIYKPGVGGSGAGAGSTGGGGFYG